MRMIILLFLINIRKTFQEQAYQERNIILVEEYTNDQLKQFKCVDSVDYEYNQVQWINKEPIQQKIIFFQSNKQIPPHFKLEINIDFLLFNVKKNFNLFINEQKYEIVYEDESIHMIKCSNDKSIPPSLNDSDELTLSKFLFTPFKDEKIEISIDLEEKVFVGIQNLNINILPCHPSCLECSGPEKSQCTKCSKNSPINGKCSDCNLYFQDGQCVDTCDESKQFFAYDQIQKVCIYSQNCEKFDNGSCIQCNIKYQYIFNGECVISCPIGYTYSQDSKICQIDKQYIQTGQLKAIGIVEAFYNNYFSDLEVNALNIKTSNFLNQNELKRVTNKCGNKKFLGGFLANKFNSQIEFEIISNNCKTVIFLFSFTIVDFISDMELDTFALQLNDQSENILLSKQQYEKNQLCGDKTKEERTYKYSKTYTIDKTKGQIQNINVKIINNNNSMKDKENTGFNKKNKYPYFGISGFTVFCTQDLCDENCLECNQNDQSVCLKCKNGYWLNQNQKCIEETKCDNQSYLDDLHKCRKCSDELQNCLECESNKQCKKCSNSFILENGKCVCDKESYLKSQNECVKCSSSIPNCSQCSSNSSCIKCNTDYQLHNNQCFSCKKEQLISNNNQCQKCLIENCKVCSESTEKCEECESGYKLNQQKCEEVKCEQNQFYNYQSSACDLCNNKFENCKECNQNECKSCNESFYLDKSVNKCFKNCPQGTFLNDKQCEPCKQQYCLMCNKDKCLQCKAGFYYFRQM